MIKSKQLHYIAKLPMNQVNQLASPKCAYECPSIVRTVLFYYSAKTLKRVPTGTAISTKSKLVGGSALDYFK